MEWCKTTTNESLWDECSNTLKTTGDVKSNESYSVQAKNWLTCFAVVPTDKNRLSQLAVIMAGLCHRYFFLFEAKCQKTVFSPKPNFVSKIEKHRLQVKPALNKNCTNGKK